MDSPHNAVHSPSYIDIVLQIDYILLCLHTVNYLRLYPHVLYVINFTKF